jgi:hypothetical protein
MDAIMPLASLPVEIAGKKQKCKENGSLLKWIPWKKEIHCTTKVGLSGATLMFMVSSPLQCKNQPTRREEEMLDKLVERYLSMI